MENLEDITSFFHILGYKEHGEWVALCLEMDLIGTGDSFDDAFVELQDVMRTQFESAKEDNDPGSLLFPADEKYFRMYAMEMSKALIGKKIDIDDDVKIVPVTAIAA